MNYLLLVLFALLSIILNLPHAIAAVPPPPLVISHNSIAGEYPCDPLKCYLRPKNQTNLLLYPMDKSTIVTSLSSGESAKIIHYEVHSIPVKGKTLITAPIPSWLEVNNPELNKGKLPPTIGEYIYLLFSDGEGGYYAWYDNNIIMVPLEGINLFPNKINNKQLFWAEYQGEGDRGSEIWFCLKKRSGEEGWIKFIDKKDWYSKYKGWGIFLDEQ